MNLRAHALGFVLLVHAPSYPTTVLTPLYDQLTDGLPSYDVGKPEEIEDGHAWSCEILLALRPSYTTSS